ncbi:MAG: PEP-CTERM sorting domain-containing protein [Burkholderiales bacterium]
MSAKIAPAIARLTAAASLACLSLSAWATQTPPVSRVPEPDTLALLAVAGIAVFVAKKWNKRK